MAELLVQGRPRRLVNAANVRTDYRLLEVSEDLLNTIITEGVVIKGADGEEAVLCTANKTFAVKYVETTNLQLLVQPSKQGDVDVDGDDDEHGADENQPPVLSAPGLQTQLHKLGAGASRAAPVVVAATNQSHLEVVETAPRLELLEQLLNARPYGLDEEGEEGGARGEGSGGSGDAMERDGSNGAGAGSHVRSDGRGEGLYTMEELLDRVQASAAEVRVGLQALGAVQLGQFWRLVEPAYLGTLLEMLISTAQQEGFPLTAIPARNICEELAANGYEPPVVMHCLATYGASSARADGAPHREDAMEVDAGAGAQAAGEDCWCLDDQKVCVHFASKLLSEGRQPLVSEFLSSWQAAVPESMQPSLDMLKGEALVQGKGNSAVIKRFSKHMLPKDPARCFEALFAEQPKWEASLLEPYIASLKVPGLSAGALLLKYARASQPTPGDPLTYSAR